MAKLIGADCRQCRREGCKLFLKGERCTSKKCAFERRPSLPGQHGSARMDSNFVKSKKLKELMAF